MAARQILEEETHATSEDKRSGTLEAVENAKASGGDKVRLLVLRLQLQQTSDFGHAREEEAQKRHGEEAHLRDLRFRMFGRSESE